MKSIILLLVIILSIGCREEVAGWDSLSQAEKDAITARAASRCNSTNGPAYSAFKVQSAGVFTSSAYTRGNGYLNEYKLDTAVLESVELRVWKQDTDRIYYYVTETNNLGSTNSYFLRVKGVQNEEMIDDLLTDYCNNKIYTSSIGEAGPLSVVYEYITAIASGTNTYTDSYTFLFGHLAFMGSYSMTRTLVVKDTDGTITSTKNYTSSFAAKTYTADFPSTDYSNTTHYTQSFCEFTEETAGIYRLSQNVIGFKKGTCGTSLPVSPGDEWDLSI